MPSRCRAEISTVMVSPPHCSGMQPVLGQLLHDPVGVGVGPVDLVEGDDDRDVGRPGVVDGLDGLRHDAVVGRDDQHHDVGRLRPSGPHGGERLVARGVDERDQVALVVDLVGADVLGDPTGLPGHHVGLADAVEQQGLAVVDVAHDGDDGWTRPQVLLVLLLVVVEVLGLQLGFLLLTRVDQADGRAELSGEQLDHVVAERLGGGDHLALLQQEAHHVGRRAVELGPDVLGGRAPLDDDLALGDGRVGRRVAGQLLSLELLEVAAPALGPALGRATTATEGRSAPSAAGPPPPGPPPGRPAKPPPAPGRLKPPPAPPVDGRPAKPGRGAPVAAAGTRTSSAGPAGARTGARRPRRGSAATQAGRGRDGLARRRQRRPLGAGRGRDGLARRRQRRGGRPATWRAAPNRGSRVAGRRSKGRSARSGRSKPPERPVAPRRAEAAWWLPGGRRWPPARSEPDSVRRATGARVGIGATGRPAPSAGRTGASSGSVEPGPPVHVRDDW